MTNANLSPSSFVSPKWPSSMRNTITAVQWSYVAPFAQETVIKKPFKLVELAAAVERALTARDGERSASNVTPIRQPNRT
jgi:hypothetical protein